MKRLFLLLYLTLCILGLIADNDIVIRRILFEGNQSFSTNQLKNILVSKEGGPVDRIIINDDTQRIINYYISRNKFMVKVFPADINIVGNGRQADILFRITESEEPVVDEIDFTGNIYFSNSKLKEFLNISNKANYTISEINNIQIELTDLYIQRGFLFVETELISVDYTDEILIALIKISEGAIVRAENFIYRGNKVTKESILAKESRISRGQILNSQSINRAKKMLESKPYIKNTYVLPVNENTILIEIEEDKMTRLSAMFAYANANSSNNKFNGFINADFLNLLGSDRRLTFSWKSLQNDFSSVKFKFHESGHNYSPLAGDISLYREEGDSTYTKTMAGLDVYYQGFAGQTINFQRIGISTEINQLFPGSRRPKIVEKQSDRKIGVFWNVDQTDDYYNPQNGWDFDIRQYTHYVKQSQSSFKRFSTEFSFQHFKPVKRNIVFTNKVNFKYMENKSLNFFDLYKAGGTYSFRGFLEDSYAGNVVFWTNTELRFLLTRFSRIFVFMDYAYIEDNRSEFQNTFNDLIGLGFGIRADTKIGLLRLDYGFSHSQNKWINPMNGIIHFGIETQF